MKSLFNDGWQFLLGDEYVEDSSSWQNITLPHDWSIYFDFDHDSPAQNEGGQLNGGTGWYRKKFYLPEEAYGKLIRIEFGGVYMNSTVYVNGHLVGNYPNGYNQFSYDITDYLYHDLKENEIIVKVINQQPSSRWYSGSGIYRDVYIMVCDQVHIPLNGIVITTPTDEASYQAEEVSFTVRTTVKNSIKGKYYWDRASVKLEYSVRSANGFEEEVIPPKTYQEDIELQPGEEVTLENTLKIKNPKLWDVDNYREANYYILTTKLSVWGRVEEEREEVFGFRYYDWDADEGFFLNGRPLKLHGVCLHHDHGALGAVEAYSLEEHRLTTLKNMGVNAIRTAHTPASNQTLEIACRLGLLVQEEAFDTWYGGKKKYDYARFFDEKALHPDAKPGETWSLYDLRTMVERGRNNPAIIMWSIGNEIAEANGDERSVKTVKRLKQAVKEADPTRYVTMGIDKFRFGDGVGEHHKIADELDVVGFNYAEDNFERIRKQHPDWKIYGSETSSAVRTKGSYFKPSEILVHDNRDIRRFEQSDYGNDKVAWGKTATESWVFDRDNKAYAGQFIWTGWDYIGEPTPWHNQNDTPPKSSYFGIVDTTGRPKNDYFLYRSQWNKNAKTLHILPHWNWGVEEERARIEVDGKVPVRVYSSYETVELFLNDKSLGKKSFKQKETSYGVNYQEGKSEKELYLEWLVEYEPGELLAVAYTKEGEVCDRAWKVTAGDSDKVALYPLEYSREELVPNEILPIYFDIEDEDGLTNPWADNLVYFEARGAGKIVGVDNGHQACRERYKADSNGVWKRSASYGEGVVFVQLDTESGGMFELLAHSEGLGSSYISIPVHRSLAKSYDISEDYPEAYEAYNLDNGYVLYTDSSIKGDGVFDGFSTDSKGEVTLDEEVILEIKPGTSYYRLELKPDEQDSLEFNLNKEVEYIQKADGDNYGKITIVFSDKSVISIQLVEPAPVYTEIGFEVEGDLFEEEVAKFRVYARRSDGIYKKLEAHEYEITVDKEDLYIEGDNLCPTKAGDYTLEIAVDNVRKKVDLTVGEYRYVKSPNYEENYFAVPINIRVDLGEKVELPEKGRIIFPGKLPEEHFVEWDKVPEDISKAYGEIVKLGFVDETESDVKARISVEGCFVADDVAVAVPLGGALELPKETLVYHTTQVDRFEEVVWDTYDKDKLSEVGNFVVEGTTKESNLPVKAYVKVSGETVKGDNISEQWTGSELPLAFASYTTEGRSASEVNDRMISLDNKPVNHWSNKGTPNESDFVGILFGDAGEIIKRQVDNTSLVFYTGEDYDIDTSFEIEYFVGDKVPVEPGNSDNLFKIEHDFNASNNWKKVTNLKLVRDGNLVEASFDMVETYAIRVVFKGEVAVTELMVFKKEVKQESDANYKILVGGEEIEGFDRNVSTYELGSIDDVEVEFEGSGLATIIPALDPWGPARVIIRAENNKLLGEYLLNLELTYETLMRVKNERKK